MLASSKVRLSSLASLRCSGHETIQRDYLAVVALYFFQVLRRCHFYYGPDLVWASLSTSLGHHEPQELSCRHPEHTYAGIELHVVRVKGVKGFLEIIQMIVLFSAFYQHVVNIDLDISSNIMCEHLVHKHLICCTHVLEAKWHHFVVEETLAGNKQSLLLIHFVHFDLVIT